jgi:hypothetical protein
MQVNEEEFECPLCFKLLAEPIAVPCSHNFCKLCLQRTLTEHKAMCPVCRTDLSFLNPEDLRANVLLQLVMRQLFPTKYEERLKEDADERRELESIIREVKKLYFGNEHKLKAHSNGEMWHKWTLFVRMDNDDNTSKYIDQVVVRLHPTFHPSTITLTEPPFEVSRLGWGVFLIRLTIKFKQEFRKPPLDLTHYLSFDGNGSFASEDIEFVTKRFRAGEESKAEQS